MVLVCLTPRKTLKPDQRLEQKIALANPYRNLKFIRHIDPKQEIEFWYAFVEAYIQSRVLRSELQQLALAAEIHNEPQLWAALLNASELDNPFRPVAPGVFLAQSRDTKLIHMDLGLSHVSSEMLDGLVHKRYSMLVFEG